MTETEGLAKEVIPVTLILWATNILKLPSADRPARKKLKDTNSPSRFRIRPRAGCTLILPLRWMRLIGHNDVYRLLKGERIYALIAKS